MDPSSLIFLAIIAIWAAYLVGQWVRRRDQLATARSIDRFSEAMRVLERRTPTRPVSAGRPTARSYVVAPVRVPAHTSPRSRTTSSSMASRADSRHDVRSGARPASVGFPARPRITREAARRRARLVLGLVVATVLAWTLVSATSLTWWPAVVVTAALGAVLVQMRRTARPARSAQGMSAPRRSGQRQPTRSAARRPAGRSSSRSRRGLASRVPAPARRSRHHEDAQSVLDKVDAARRSPTRPVPSSAVVGGAVLADVDPDVAHTGPAEASAPSAATTTAQGWQPVPVPPPTYTLKPKARPVARRPVESEVLVADADVSDDTRDGAGATDGQRDDVRTATSREPAPAAAAFDLDEILERRIASGS